MVLSFDYLRSLPQLEEEAVAAFRRVLHSGRLILGPETEAFEHEFARYVGARECVAVTSGTMALYLGLRALEVGSGDEVITAPNTCSPTVAAIRMTGATPVFADVRDHDLMIDPQAVERAVTRKTRVILPVHLWGHAVQVERLLEISSDCSAALVEDCAQATGTTISDRHVGAFGALGCFSFYPTKNLGAYGEGGAVVTDDREVAVRLRRLRMYGYDKSGQSQIEGTNGRFSEIQAAILRIKLRLLPDWLERRRRAADFYRDNVVADGLRLPPVDPDSSASYHQFVIRCSDRDAVTRALEEQGIQSAVHYPVPLHKMPAYRTFAPPPGGLAIAEGAASEILSLPVHEALEASELEEVARALNKTALTSDLPSR